MPPILLSFDVEEFDTAIEFGNKCSIDEQMRITEIGLRKILDLLTALNISATFFTTVNFALRHEPLIRQIAERHEIASHGYMHASFENVDLVKSKAELERITSRPVVGFRRARMGETDRAEIERAGYLYNSSENPTWIPGRYNHFFAPRLPYFTGSLLNIPASVTPIIRFPLFWLTLKNFPLWLNRQAARWCLASDGQMNLYFHPWEFVELGAYKLPAYMKRLDGQAMLDRLTIYLRWLSGRGTFITFGAFAERMRAEQSNKETHG